MSIWGKIGGAAAGFAIGGPIGALIGGVAGHFIIDQGLLAAEPLPPRETVAFTVGLIALAAKMAKADGVVTRDEVAAFRKLVDVDAQDLPRVTALFDLAKESTAGYDAYARQLRDLLRNEPGALEDLIDGLFDIATADHAVHEAELAYLQSVAAIFGIYDKAFARIAARHMVADRTDPYLVLGIDRDASPEDIRRAWRKLVTENHPDKLIARGVPPELVVIATQKVAAINAAYEALKKAHALP